MTLRNAGCMFLVGLLASWPALGAEGGTPLRYDNYRAVRVLVGAPEDLARLEAAGARLLSEAVGVGPVDYLVAPQDMAALQRLHLPQKVLNENVQAAIDAERQSMALPVSPLDPDWFATYRTYDQVNEKLNQMAADRPDLASVFDVGLSCEGRHIYGIRISGPGADKPAIEFTGCHHAREWITVMVPLWIADQLVYSYDSDPRIHALVDSLDFFIVPIVNVDGYVYSQVDRMWRKNRHTPPEGSSCYGVDLNRNYAMAWNVPGGSSSSPCSDLYRGIAPFSEAETAAMRDFVIAHPRIVALQSYHSFSQLIMSPYGYTPAPPPDNDIFLELDRGQHDAILAVHGVQYNYGPIYTTIYQTTGGDVDWYYTERGIWAFSTEVRDTGEYGFLLPPDQIVPTCEENFAAALYLSEWCTSPVKISFPDGLPSRLDPGQPRSVTVKIIAVGATLDAASPRLRSRVGAGAFTESPLVSLGDDLYQAVLPATACGATREYYFLAATTAGVTGISPLGAPQEMYEVTAVPITSVLSEAMDANPGWAAQADWAWGDPIGTSGDPAAGHTGDNVYGYKLGGLYPHNMPERHLTTPALNCLGLTGTKLSFWRWLGVEKSTWDHAYVRISTTGLTWTNIWQNPDDAIIDMDWVYQEFDISSIADGQPLVYLRWTMGTTDGSIAYCGWNIDDVRVWADDPDGCPPRLGDLNCDGAVNTFDIDPFVLALTDNVRYAAEFPACDPMLADANGDGAVNTFDIDPFVILLVSGS